MNPTPDPRPATTISDSDVLNEETLVGLNRYGAGVRIPERPTDGSLPASERSQTPVPPNSLVWKYFGDYRNFFFGLRMATIENMWPQLGQAISDHSVVLKTGDLAGRARRSNLMIGGVVYSAPDEGRKSGLQVRNFHKSIKGEMPSGRTYHSLDPETYYWAHVTMFEVMFKTVDLLYPRPLTRAEKAQIFEESKSWFSMYGVDTSAQPETYEEFEVYWQHVLENELIDSSAVRYTVGYATSALPAPANLPWVVRKVVWPQVSRLARLANVGALEPVLRERLGLEWSAADERNFRAFCAVVRGLGPLYEQLPLRLRYIQPAVSGFEREGIDPKDITLESARAALKAQG